MADTVQIQLAPRADRFAVVRGSPLRDLLFPHGVEFPCGGHGRCKGCRIRVLRGVLPVTPDDERLLSARERANGWRLACRAVAEQDLVLELAQWEPTILSDNRSFNFTPRPGLGIAFDLGTTTLVGQLLDLQTGRVLAVQTALNHQGQHGADIMSRIDFAVNGGQAVLQTLIREQLRQMLGELVTGAGRRSGPLQQVTIVGNTAMHHLFSGVSVKPLAHFPFHPEHDGLQEFSFAELGWNHLPVQQHRIPIAPDATVRFLPCLGGFVGSDILAGILASGLQHSESLVGLIDLGTNGEMVLGNRERLLCASTAAGPAFEGARISQGMRAVTGAISEVALQNREWRVQVLGNSEARGLCGSGLVDAVACGLELGEIEASGKLPGGKPLRLTRSVELTQKDVRELQLAKGAIAAGFRILLQHWGAPIEAVSRLYLAGAFGNYINRTSARRIGLLQFDLDRIEPAGNTALLGAKLDLFGVVGEDGQYSRLRKLVQHVSLNEDEKFEEIFVDELSFPG